MPAPNPAEPEAVVDGRAKWGPAPNCTPPADAYRLRADRVSPAEL
jgi:hypothetical protein